jgi:hypothetical protein
MTGLPSIQTVPCNATQRSRLERWLDEWSIDRRLRDGDALCGAPPRTDLTGNNATEARQAASPHTIAPCVERVAVGQILLLHPSVPGAGEHPRYLAILEQDGADTFVAVPYSRFAEPATPGELLTGREAPCLRVVCAWNARSLPASVLAHAWLIDTLTDAERREILCILNAARTDEPPPPELAERTGLAPRHPLDPRHDYMDAERTAMNLVAAGKNTQGSQATVYPLGRSEDSKAHGLPLAAEERETYRADGEQDNRHTQV